MLETLKPMSEKETLALFGGKKVIKNTPPPYNPIGEEEVEAVTAVIKSGVLSKFLGCWDPDFFGGPKVQEFERKCEKYFDVKHAITVNSWTSGLIASVGAIGIEPGDEVIVSPWTMCATATAIVHWNAIPVFADIEPDTFCLDPKSVEANISEKTRGIIAVDIFGQSSDMRALRQIANKYDLKIISDTAQAPASRNGQVLSGTLSDIGGFSLNYHKHIHVGEGGILVTNNDFFADRLRLIRNHGEAVISDMGFSDPVNIIGYNFRLGEMEAAIGIEQLSKLKMLLVGRQTLAERLTKNIGNLAGLSVPVLRKNCTHAYYIYPMILDIDKIGVSRDKLAAALKAEGVPGLIEGYQNIHLLPMFQNKIAYGSGGFPWKTGDRNNNVDYRKGICPIAEQLHDKTFLGIEMCAHDFTLNDIDLVGEAFNKVWKNLELL